MSEPFLGEIRVVGFDFPPKGWAFCDGQILPINQNQALFSILGDTYGGDGITTFALPDLRGRTPVHMGNGHTLGEMGGQEVVALTAEQMAQHSHAVNASQSVATITKINETVLLANGLSELYVDPTAPNQVAIRPGTVGNAGGGMAHNNMQPFITLSYCIALQGSFPSRN